MNFKRMIAVLILFSVFFTATPSFAWKTGYSEQQVRRVLRTLEKEGILKVVERKAGKSTHYKIVLEAGKQKLPRVITPSKMSGVSKSNPLHFGSSDPLHFDGATPDMLSAKNDDEPSIEPSIEPSTASPFVEMKNAIAKSFGWDKPTDSEWGKIQKAAKLLLKAEVKPEEIKSLYDYCNGKLTSFSPLALPNHVSDWRKAQPKAITKIIEFDLSDWEVPGLESVS
jgi:hypothetical protein